MKRLKSTKLTQKRNYGILELMRYIKAQLKDFKTVQKGMNLLYLSQIDSYWCEEENIKREIQNGKFYILKDKLKILGVFSIQKSPYYLNIDSFVIFRKYRGMGYGAKMVTYIEDIAVKEKINALSVSTQRYYKAWGFYEKQGFKRVGKDLYCQRVYYQYEKKI
jgi:N-acetylglutamate synthase-like GNAT family acetyltransferase